jgi:galactokinase
MMVSQQPHRQSDVEFVILEALVHKRTMTTQEVYAAVRHRLDLAPADLEKANKRDNERKIDQIIANALQEGRTLCRRGWIERIGKGEFRITSGGEAQLQQIAADIALLDDLMPDEE